MKELFWQTVKAVALGASIVTAAHLVVYLTHWPENDVLTFGIGVLSVAAVWR